MKISPQIIEKLVRSGANVSIDGSDCTPQTLIHLVIAAVESGSMVTIRNASDLPSQTLESITMSGRKHVTLEF